MEDRADTEKKFFVRMSGDLDEWLPKVEKAFGEVTTAAPDDVTGEFGFVTGKIKEGFYEEKAAGFPNILQMLRVEE